MGNNHGGSSLQSSEEFSYVLQKAGSTRAGKCTEQWAAVYYICGRSCQLLLTKTDGVGIGDEKLVISIQDDVSANKAVRENMEVKRANDHKFTLTFAPESDGYSHGYSQRLPIIPSSNIRRSKDVMFYGDGSERKSLVFASKDQRMDEDLSVLTVTYYLAVCTEKIDIGLSMMVSIKDNGWRAKSDLDFKGPVQHPAYALLRMFHEVREERHPHWIPKCPHCEYDRNRKKPSVLWGSSESEDSDDPVPAQFRSHQRTQGGVLANGGPIKGDGNGNIMLIRKLLLGK